MKINTLATAATLLFASNALADTAVPYERLSKNDSVLLIVDLQVGLAAAVRDWDATMFRNAMFAHASIGKTFDIPTILTTSEETGPNGPLPKEIVEMYPDAPYIPRPGEVNVWDNADFRAAVRATGRKQLIVAGIATDICVAFLALSLRSEGYHVVVNAEASGTFFDSRVATYAINRMQEAGVQIMNYGSILSELFRDWRSINPGAADVVSAFNRFIAAEAWVLRTHAAAILNGTVIPGEARLVTVKDNNPPTH